MFDHYVNEDYSLAICPWDVFATYVLANAKLGESMSLAGTSRRPWPGCIGQVFSLHNKSAFQVSCTKIAGLERALSNILGVILIKAQPENESPRKQYQNHFSLVAQWHFTISQLHQNELFWYYSSKCTLYTYVRVVH